MIIMRDRDIRTALRFKLDHLFADAPDTVVVDELGLCEGEARVDIAVINGRLHGYEIKSERDTLERLPAQRDIYNRALETVTVIVSKSHSEKVAALIPEWWGIIEAIDEGNQHVTLILKRDCSINPNRDPLAMVRLLWRSEALAILKEKGLANGLLSKPRTALWRKLVDSVTVEELGALIRFHIKARLKLRSAQPLLSDDATCQPCATSLRSPAHLRLARTELCTHRPN